MHTDQADTYIEPFLRQNREPHCSLQHHVTSTSLSPRETQSQVAGVVLSPVHTGGSAPFSTRGGSVLHSLTLCRQGQYQLPKFSKREARNTHTHNSHGSPPLFLFPPESLSFQHPPCHPRSPLWPRESGAGLATPPRMAPADGERGRETWLTVLGFSVPKLLPTIPWLSGSRLGPGPVYQLQSQALKLEASQTDKGEPGDRGALQAPAQVCSGLS